MALKSGFYNAFEIDGEFDRVYSADEYTNFYSAFLRDGVRRSGADDFKCTANGLIITVAAGYAICGSKWVNNETASTLAAITPPVGEYSRIDGVFLHVDINEATRAASIVYRTGTPAANPQPPAKVTTTGIFELCLCQVKVAPAATTVQLTDTRANPTLCGWITTPVGYDEYFVALDDHFEEFLNESEIAFNAWFDEVKDTLSSVTLFKQYTWYLKTTDTTTTSVSFDIPQYDPTGVDIVQVYTNGLLETRNIDYTLDGSTITFIYPKIANTEILVVVYKSIDGEGLGSVSDEVTALQNQVDAMEDVYEFNYICNGETDNEGIRTFLNSKKDSLAANGQIKLNIYGTFGATNTTGTIQYHGTTYGILFFLENWGDKRIILDFANCSAINIDGDSFTNKLARIFSLPDVKMEIWNMNGKFENAYSFSWSNTYFRLYNSRIFIDYGNSTVSSNGYGTFANNGVFEDCRIEALNASCFESFEVTKSLKIINCDCYAYGLENGSVYAGAVIRVATSRIYTPVYTSQMNCPKVDRAGYVQRYAIADYAAEYAHATYSGTITTLPITAAGQNVSGTINLSVPFM